MPVTTRSLIYTIRTNVQINSKVIPCKLHSSFVSIYGRRELINYWEQNNEIKSPTVSWDHFNQKKKISKLYGLSQLQEGLEVLTLLSPSP